MDIATLGLEVRSDGVVVAKNRLRDFQGEAKRSETATDKLSASVKRMATSFVAGAAAAFSFRAIATVLTGFEQSMASVAAITGATGQELAALRDIAKELGATTEFSASQAADGLKFLGMAGFDAAESIQAIPDVLNLATAASMDLAQAADITSNIMGAFGIAATNANQAADVLALAASRANTDVAQLGSAMAMAGPVANALGVDIGETAAAIGALSDLGIQGSMAGTGLRRVLSSLANATPAATKALNGLGLSMSDLNPATNELVDIVDRLAEVNLSAADAFTIFGDRGAPAILALIENNAKLRELTGELGNADGAARRMAETMRDNLAGDFKGLVSATEAVIIALGESGLTGVLRSMTQMATGFLRGVADSMDAILRAATGLAVYMGGAYVMQFGLAAAATTALSASLRLLRLAIAGTGIGALVLIVTDVVFRIYDAATATDDLAEKLEGVTEPARTVFDFLKTGAEAIHATFEWLGAGIAASMMGAFSTIYTAYADLVNGINAGLRLMGIEQRDMDRNWAGGVANNLGSQRDEAFRQMRHKWGQLFGGGDPFLGTFEALGGSKTFDSVDAMWEALGRGSPVLTDLTDKTDILSGSIGGVGTALEAANDNLSEMGNIGQQVVGRLSTAFTDLFEAAISGGKDLGQIVLNLIRDLGRMFLNQGFQALLSGGLGGFNPLGWLGGLFGGFRANGGPVQAGVPYVVGERGPELFVPQQSGGIVPNHAMKNGPANQNVKVDITVKVDGARGNAEIQEMVQIGVAQGMKTVEKNIGNMVTDWQVRYA